ncbi:hypothetical protein [Neisseria sp. Ec49-e6-T10]|uniref:hypothetical protein n=1 Tax=Neisseria sp. Ec49-e6-T10 TaxID=3140744 RepID=UPI003EBE439F
MFKQINYFTVILISLTVNNLICASPTFEQQQIQQQENQNMFQEVNELLIQGRNSLNDDLVRQAKNKLSLWLKSSEQTLDHKTLAQALRTRASASMLLGEINDAIDDYKNSNQYDPIGEVQFGICLLEKTQGAKPSDLQSCYNKTVQIYADKQTTKNDPNYLIARIFNGDKTAIAEYKKLIETTPESIELEAYTLIAQKLLDKSVCEQILPICANNDK